MGSRRGRHAPLALVALAGCGRLDFAQRAIDAAPAIDRCADGEPDLGPFGAPSLVAAVNSPSTEDDPTPSDDGLELYFDSSRAPTLGMADVWRVSRSAIDQPWGAPEHVVALSSALGENTPELSHDALTIWVVSDRAGTLGADDIWVATRADRASPWSVPVDVTVLNSTSLDRGPSLYHDDTAMLFHSARTGPTRFYIAQRPDLASPWSPPVMVAPFDPGAFRAWISPCGFEIYYEADRGTGTMADIFYARRASLADPFALVRGISELDSPRFDQDIRLSPDRHHVYFASDRTGNGDIYEASR